MRVVHGARCRPRVGAHRGNAASVPTQPPCLINRASVWLAVLLPFAIAFVAELIIAYVLYGILMHMGQFTIRAGIISGAFCWFGFVLTTVAVNNAFSGRSAKLTAIDGGHWLGALIIIGAIVGAMGP